MENGPVKIMFFLFPLNMVDLSIVFCQSLSEGKSHKIPLKHHFLWISYGRPMVFLPVPLGVPLVFHQPNMFFPQQPGVLVFDNKDIHLQATYIWVKAGV